MFPVHGYVLIDREDRKIKGHQLLNMRREAERVTGTDNNPFQRCYLSRERERETVFTGRWQDEAQRTRELDRSHLRVKPICLKPQTQCDGFRDETDELHVSLPPSRFVFNNETGSFLTRV